MARIEFERVDGKKRQFVCQWCGKRFVPQSKHPRKWCSEECRASGLRAYNTQYQAEKRAKQSLSEKDKAHRNQLQNQAYARKVWESWKQAADDIIVLMQNTSQGYDVRNSIAKYLSDNFRRRTTKEKVPDFSSIFSANTADKKIEESLGDGIDN